MNGWKFFFLIILVFGGIGYFSDKSDNSKKQTSDVDAAYFSAWDGSNPELVASVKENMNDPESFKHISTDALNNPNGTIKIQMKFSGKNAFGGTMTNTVTADFNKSTRKIDNLKKTQ